MLAVAEALRPEFPDAVTYVALAGLADAHLVVPVIAQALGVREVGAPGRQSAIRERLQTSIGQQKLLLDNFEPVIAAAADANPRWPQCHPRAARDAP